MNKVQMLLHVLVSRLQYCRLPIPKAYRPENMPFLKQTSNEEG